MSELPFIDEHVIGIAAPRGVAWTALEQYVAAFLRRAEGGLLTRLLGAVPRAGFEIAERVPPARLTLAGRHRFARYQLAFDLTGGADGATHLRATTHAEFPGVRGRVYRALVIGTRAHVVATTHILRSIRRRALKTVACVVLAFSTFLGSGARWASAEVPTWIAAEPPDTAGRPLWVSVEAALATDGSFRSELFSPELVAAMVSQVSYRNDAGIRPEGLPPSRQRLRVSATVRTRRTGEVSLQRNSAGRNHGRRAPREEATMRRSFVLIATAVVLFTAVQTADAMICVAGDSITLRRVQGIVVAETEGGLDSVLPGAVVEITGGDFNAETVTDEDGYFTFGELRPGNYEIRANLEGFRPIRDTIRVRSQGASEGRVLVLALPIGFDSCGGAGTATLDEARRLQRPLARGPKAGS